MSVGLLEIKTCRLPHPNILLMHTLLDWRTVDIRSSSLLKTSSDDFFLIKDVHGCVCLFCFVISNVTFKNISVISWRSVLIGGENHRPVASDWQTFYHIMLYTSPWSRLELTTAVVIGTDYIGNCKSNYHMITATTAPRIRLI